MKLRNEKNVEKMTTASNHPIFTTTHSLTHSHSQSVKEKEKKKERMWCGFVTKFIDMIGLELEKTGAG